MFVNRVDELAWLDESYNSDRAEFLVIYGRRRVGKSALARRSIRGRDDVVYYQARESTPQIQLEDFVEVAAEHVPEVADLRLDWEVILARLGEQDRIVIIDEFPYLVTADPSVPSTFQRAWDLSLQETASTLVLVGSSLSIMEDEVLSAKSPLFGRRTGNLDLAPLTLWEAGGFLPGWSSEDRVLAWSVFGGMPHSLEHVDPSQGILENVQALILSPGSLLHDEGEFLLQQAFAQPSTYLAIVQAVAAGKRTPNEIAQKAGVEAASVGTYLRKLCRTRVLEREVPVTEDPARSRKGQYRIADPFLAFWFRFVHAHRSQIALLGDDAAEQLVAPAMADHAAEPFERVCQQALPRLLAAVPFQRIGRWWYGEHEIDVVGLTSSDQIVLGECKFSNAPVSTRDLHRLEQKAEHVRWSPERGGPREESFALFSRGGFEDALVDEAAARSDVHLFELDDLVDACETPGL